jgi:hypothetical protein
MTAASPHRRLARATDIVSLSLVAAQLLSIVTSLSIGITKQSFYVGAVTLVVAAEFFYVLIAFVSAVVS